MVKSILLFHRFVHRNQKHSINLCVFAEEGVFGLTVDVDGSKIAKEPILRAVC